jgi:hypothetical protein
MKVFDNLILTISMKLMGYSDFMLEGKRVFYTHAQYLRYLRAYAEKFDLRRHIVFHTSAENVKKTEDGRWRVTTASTSGERAEHGFDAVAICSGPFQIPNRKVADLEKFTGEVIHSYQYRNNEAYRNKRVLVVGLAESGADIVREISNVASQCTLSIRSYSYMIPRLPNGEDATDTHTVRSHHYEMYVRATRFPYEYKAIFGDNHYSRFAFSAVAQVYGAADLVAQGVKYLFGKRTPDNVWNGYTWSDVTRRPSGNQVAGIDPLGQPVPNEKIDIDTENNDANIEAVGRWNRRSHRNESNWSPRIIFVKNASFIPNIVNGKIDLNDAGIEKIEGKRVHFKDKKVKEYDAIVLCTGFKRDFSVLGKDVAVQENNVRNLYKHGFFPEHGGRVALIGFVRPFSGGIPPCAEMQARYFAQLCSNKLTLPSNVHEQIRAEKAWEEQWTSLSPGATEAIPSQAMFMDSIAKEIGCLMPMSELIMKPTLFVRHWFYPFNQVCYRLRGPHSFYDEAVKELMSDVPGSWTKPKKRLMLMRLLMLPSSMHPKYLGLTPHVPEDALEPKSTRPNRSVGASIRRDHGSRNGEVSL